VTVNVRTDGQTFRTRIFDKFRPNIGISTIVGNREGRQRQRRQIVELRGHVSCGLPTIEVRALRFNCQSQSGSYRRGETVAVQGVS
jgi:hypothetical protein